MVLASPYVIERIYRALEEDSSRGWVVFEKFSYRYSEDLKLIEIYDKLKNKEEMMTEVKKSLEDLKIDRRLRTDSVLDRCYTWYLWHKTGGGR